MAVIVEVGLLWAAIALAACFVAMVARAQELGPDDRLVVMRGGRVARLVAGPGLRLVLPWIETGIKVSLRPQRLTLNPPALQAADGAWVGAVLDVGYTVLMPEKAAEVMRHASLRLAVQELVLTTYRELAGGLPAERMIEAGDRQQLGRAIKKAANETALGWGIDVGQVDVVELREIAEPAGGEDQALMKLLAGLAEEGRARETVDVMLRAPGDRRPDVIAVLRRLTGWDAAKASAVVEQAPYAIMHRVPRDDAELVRRELEGVGAVVELVGGDKWAS